MQCASLVGSPFPFTVASSGNDAGSGWQSLRAPTPKHPAAGHLRARHRPSLPGQASMHRPGQACIHDCTSCCARTTLTITVISPPPPPWPATAGLLLGPSRWQAYRLIPIVKHVQHGSPGLGLDLGQGSRGCMPGRRRVLYCMAPVPRHRRGTLPRARPTTVDAASPAAAAAPLPRPFVDVPPSTPQQWGTHVACGFLQRAAGCLLLAPPRERGSTAQHGTAHCLMIIIRAPRPLGLGKQARAWAHEWERAQQTTGVAASFGGNGMWHSAWLLGGNGYAKQAPLIYVARLSPFGLNSMRGPSWLNGLMARERWCSLVCGTAWRVRTCVFVGGYVWGEALGPSTARQHLPYIALGCRGM